MEIRHSSGHMAGAATSWSHVPAPSTGRPDPCDDTCKPRCPACGGLKCICRPRFFPGQLLTDKELNGLQQYVVDKNRLHNSYLHGWGVACGLEVVCDECDSGRVVVRDGYALSPCGDDIVVCSEQSVAICDLINDCQPREPNCDDPHDSPRDCTGGVKKWVLAICYDERPVRGITPQLGAGDSPGHGRCSCGGSGSCGCGSGTKATGSGGCSGGKGGQCSCASTAPQSPATGRQYKPQCEPTQVCEGYRFIAYPAPDERRRPSPRLEGRGDLMWAWLFANRSQYGPLLDRVLCCATRAMELQESLRQGVRLNDAKARYALVDYAEGLADFASGFSIHGCSFVSKAHHLREEARVYAKAPVTGTVARRTAELTARFGALDDTWLEIVSECLCSALLPACPTPPSLNCVPLAVVTIDADDGCRIVDICNWSERKILITWPTISYWLSWLPWREVRKWILELCCGSRRSPQAYSLLALLFQFVFNQAKAPARADSTPVALEDVGAMIGAPMSASAAPGGASARRSRAKTPAAPDPVAEAFASDDFVGHMLKDVARLRSEGADAVGMPAWAGLVARLADPAVLTALAEEGPRIADLTRRLDAAEKKLGALSRKGGK